MTIPRDGGEVFSVGELQVVGDNYDRWGSLLFSFSIKILYLDIYELLMVNYVALTERR